MAVEQKQVWLATLTMSIPDPHHPYGEAITCFNEYPSDADLTEVFCGYGFSGEIIASLLEDGTAYLINENQYKHTIYHSVWCVPMRWLKV